MMAQRPITNLIDNAEHWWSRAEEARSIASELQDPHTRWLMEQVAVNYEYLARRAEGMRETEER